VKSHFADEERLRGRENLRGQREASETKRKFGDSAKKDFEKNIFMEVYL
jgi:hypothetical protein